MQTKDAPSRAIQGGFIFDTVHTGRFLFFCIPDYDDFLLCHARCNYCAMRGAFGNQTSFTEILNSVLACLYFLSWEKGLMRAGKPAVV